MLVSGSVFNQRSLIFLRCERGSDGLIVSLPHTWRIVPGIVSSYIATMVIVSPLTGVVPLPNGLNDPKWLINSKKICDFNIYNKTTCAFGGPIYFIDSSAVTMFH